MVIGDHGLTGNVTRPDPVMVRLMGNRMLRPKKTILNDADFAGMVEAAGESATSSLFSLAMMYSCSCSRPQAKIHSILLNTYAILRPLLR